MPRLIGLLDMALTGINRKVHHLILKGKVAEAISECKQNEVDYEEFLVTSIYAAQNGMVDWLVHVFENGYSERISIATRDVAFLTPLHHAVVAEQIEVVKFLLEKGVDADGGMKYVTPLLLANEGSQLIKLLRKHGASDSFFVHVKEGNQSAVKRYLSKDSEAVKLVDEFNCTPLFHSLRHPEMVQLLLNNDADINAREKRKNTVLHYLVGGHYQGNKRENKENEQKLQTEVLDILLERGADIAAINHRKVTPLHNACRSGNLPVAKRLIAEGAYINARDVKGETPLFRVINKKSEYELAKYLIEKGADTKIKSKSGKTIESIAAKDNLSLL